MTSLFLALLAAAFAGEWLPEPPVELAAEPLVLEQPGQIRLLVKTEPLDVALEVWSGGLRVPARPGPAGTLLVPSDRRWREIEITAPGAESLQVWRETGQGEAAAWDDYERCLARWARQGGLLPAAPSPIPGLALEWRARRSAMVAMGELDPPVLLGAMLQDLVAVRARSGADHGAEIVGEGVLAAGEERELLVQGPGLLSISTRLRVEGADEPGRYQVLVALGGAPRGRFTLESGPSRDEPDLGWARKVHLAVPEGDHVVTWRLRGEDGSMPEVEVEESMARRRGSVQLLPSLAPARLRGAKGPVGRLISGHAAGAADMVDRAWPLLGTEADSLARSVLVLHLESPADALDTWAGVSADPLAAWALARRWLERRDIDPSLLLAVGHLLPQDPALLAAVADALPEGFVRPRGVALRLLADLAPDELEPVRWTMLVPEGDRELVRVHGFGSGIPRVVVEAGQMVEVDLPEPVRAGRFPVLRLEAGERSRYRVDGQLREGAGTLDEALSPGRHALSVEEGRLVLADGALVEGGAPARDRWAAPLPARWRLPDPGVPVEVELLVDGPPEPMVASTDDGMSWEVRPDRGAFGDGGQHRVVLQVGPHARELVVEGSGASRVAASMRRTRGGADVAVPASGLDPWEALHDASAAMLGEERPEAMARHRISRAAALHAIGLVVSAQQEARAVAAMEEATPEQRAQAMALYRDTIPPVHTSLAPGPVTVDAALAWEQRGGAGPLACHELVDIAASLSPPVSWPVHRDAAECLRARGDLVGAWTEAAAAGPMGTISRARVAGSGQWRLVTRVDRNGGTRRLVLPRDPPGEGDGVAARARELALGAPWGPETYTVVREGRQATLAFEGRGRLELQLLCRDESSAVEPEPCLIPLDVDGVEEILHVDDSTIVTWEGALRRGAHSVLVGPPDGSQQALVVRASLDGRILLPRLPVTAHLIGASGLEVTVAGPTLARLRVREGGPVTVRVAGPGLEATWEARDDLVFPITSSGPSRVVVEGSREAAVSLSLLEPCPEPDEPRPPLPRPLETEVPELERSEVIQAWVDQAGGLGRPVFLPTGTGGTLYAGLRGGDDATGIQDSTRSFRYMGALAGFRERVDGARVWREVEASTRLSPDGASGAVLQGRYALVTMPDLFWLQASFGAAGGAGHVAARGEWRRRLEAGPWWTFQPFGRFRLGYWTGPGAGHVDPAAWTAWSAQHFFGLGAGGHADWRPARDGRLRFTLEALSNPNLTPDHLRGEVRADLLVLPATSLSLASSLEQRFADVYRSRPYRRGLLKAGLTHAPYLERRHRLLLDSSLVWCPGDGAVEGWLGVTLERSRSRGVRDQSPFDIVFPGAFHLPLEEL